MLFSLLYAVEVIESPQYLLFRSLCVFIGLLLSSAFGHLVSGAAGLDCITKLAGVLLKSASR